MITLENFQLLKDLFMFNRWKDYNFLNAILALEHFKYIYL